MLPPPLPIYLEPIAPPDRVTARRLVVAELHEALARQDYPQAALFNALLSQEAPTALNRSTAVGLSLTSINKTQTERKEQTNGGKTYTSSSG